MVEDDEEGRRERGWKWLRVILRKLNIKRAHAQNRSSLRRLMSGRGQANLGDL